MAATFRLDLVSPERLLLSEEVASVTLPGSEGYFTVMAGHAPLLSALRPGVIEIARAAEGGGADYRIYVRGGFAEVNADGTTVLADRALPTAEMTEAEFESERSLLAQSLDNLAPGHPDRTGAQQRIDDLDSYKRWILPA